MASPSYQMCSLVGGGGVEIFAHALPWKTAVNFKHLTKLQSSNGMPHSIEWSHIIYLLSVAIKRIWLGHADTLLSHTWGASTFHFYCSPGMPNTLIFGKSRYHCLESGSLPHFLFVFFHLDSKQKKSIQGGNVVTEQCLTMSSRSPQSSSTR